MIVGRWFWRLGLDKYMALAWLVISLVIDEIIRISFKGPTRFVNITLADAKRAVIPIFENTMVQEHPTTSQPFPTP